MLDFLQINPPPGFSNHADTSIPSFPFLDPVSINNGGVWNGLEPEAFLSIQYKDATGVHQTTPVLQGLDTGNILKNATISIVRISLIGAGGLTGILQKKSRSRRDVFGRYGPSHRAFPRTDERRTRYPKLLPHQEYSGACLTSKQVLWFGNQCLLMYQVV